MLKAGSVSALRERIKTEVPAIAAEEKNPSDTKRVSIELEQS